VYLLTKRQLISKTDELLSRAVVGHKYLLTAAIDFLDDCDGWQCPLGYTTRLTNIIMLITS
jgi:hypothetical protein